MAAGAVLWQTDRVEPLVRDLVRFELSRLRPGGGVANPAACAGRSSAPESDPDCEVEATPADSLELLTLATSVSRYFHIHETGLDDLLLARRSSADWAETIVRSRSAWDEAVTFSTSGSTGDPKTCTHGMADLRKEVGFLAELFAGRRRIVGVQPVHHIYGFLFTFMLPAALAVPVVDHRRHGPASLFRRAAPGDLIVAHPKYLELATSLPVIVPEDVTVVTSTSPSDRSLWERLAGAGVARIVEIYGSSETAGVAWRQSPDRPFELMPHWSRAGDDRIARRDSPDRPRPIQDRVRWSGDRTFHVGDRIDGAVQVGGINVFPGRVRDLLLQHPAVSDAAVRLMRRDEGSRLKTFVVLRGNVAGSPALADELTNWLEARLDPLEVPRSYRFGSAVPVTEAGKPADWSVAA